MKKQDVNVTLTLTAKQAGALWNLLAWSTDDVDLVKDARELLKVTTDAMVEAGVLKKVKKKD